MRLQDLVAELGVADARLGSAGPATASLASIWLTAEVLADVAQEVDRRQARGPVQVVHHAAPRSARRSRGTARPARGCRSTQPATTSGALSIRSAVGRRVADQPGRAADQAERPVAGLLEPAQRSAAAPGCRCAGSARSGRSRNRT